MPLAAGRYRDGLLCDARPPSGVLARATAMLKLTGCGTAHTCDGLTRRDFLEVGALSAIGLSLPQLAAAKEQGLVAKEHDDRSVIMIFNLGAPSQMDTFDPKPEAAAEIRGPFKPISTKGDFQITEILPRHAA